MTLLKRDEDRDVRRLWHLRDEVAKRLKEHPRSGGDGWHHNERAEAENLKLRLRAREAALRHAARQPRRKGGGWGVVVKPATSSRGTRFQIIHLTRINDHHGHPSVWDHHGSLQERVLKIAKTQVGVMEHGGNNMGAQVSRYIRENGGFGPEPWCGDFVAFCYRHAGSHLVSRSWASAWNLEGARTSHPVGGDIVDYTFQHTGIFVKALGGAIETIEGNTGASGAVSDSATGGDGVYEKRRPTGLVKRYVRVKG